MAKTLEQWRETIEENVDYVDVKPFSSNIIGLALRAIGEGYGESEAKKAVKDFGLDKLGWSV